MARSTNGGESWSVVLPDVDARTVLVDPFDPAYVYAGNRDYSGLARDKIFWKSSDYGQTWDYRSGNGNFVFPFLEDHAGDVGLRWHLATLTADPAREGRLYAGFLSESYDDNFGGGLFYSDDRGETWHLFDFEGLQTYSIRRITLDPVVPRRKSI